MVKKDVSPMHPDLRTLLDMTKKRERERACAILGACQAYKASVFFSFVIHGPEHLHRAMEHYGYSAISMNYLAELERELLALEEQYK